MFRTRSEDEKAALELRIAETQKERDSTQIEVQEAKVQLHLCEDKIDDLNNQLQDTVRKLKECEFFFIHSKYIINHTNF